MIESVRLNEMMKWLLSVCIYLVLSVSSAYGESYSEEIDDLPIMAGYEILDQETVYFDKPDGRIIVLMAFHPQGKLSEDVQGFYKKSLPQLGWQLQKSGYFQRGKELLKIEPLVKEDGHYIRFTLMPIEKN